MFIIQEEISVIDFFIQRAIRHVDEAFLKLGSRSPIIKFNRTIKKYRNTQYFYFLNPVHRTIKIFSRQKTSL